MVDVEVYDNCDANPTLVVTSPGAVIDRQGRVASATFSAEGLYNVDFRVTDAKGNVATLSDVRFGIDRTAPQVRLTGVDEAADPNDPFTFPVVFPGDKVQLNAAADDKASDVRSGLVEVTVALTHRDTARARTIHRVEYALDASTPPAGRSGAKNLLCADVVPPGEETWCDEAGELIADAIEAGDWDLTVSAVDAAGNASSASRPLTSMSWRIAMNRSESLARRLLNGGLGEVGRLFLQQLPDRPAVHLHLPDRPRHRRDRRRRDAADPGVARQGDRRGRVSARARDRRRRGRRQRRHPQGRGLPDGGA